jgi:transposase
MTDINTDLITVGVDPHRSVFTASVLDERGRNLGHEHFSNTRAGHAAALAWAQGLGTIDRVGIEGAGGLGRPLAEYLVDHGVDVRDVPPHKTSLRQRGRHEGKSDRLDAHRVAAEAQANDSLAHAFKHSQPAPPDPVRDQIALWHNARTSLRKIRVQIIGELDALIQQLPEQLRDQLPTRTTVRAKINAVASLDTTAITDPVHRLRICLLEHRIQMLRKVLSQDKTAEPNSPDSSPRSAHGSRASPESPPGPLRRSSSRPATCAGSPSPASPATTAPHPFPPAPEKPAHHPSDTA